MNRILLVASGCFVLFSGCLSVVDAREVGAQRTCAYEQRCGNIGSGQRYATPAECVTDKRADFQNTWPTDRCDGKINGEAFESCLKSIDNTRCNDFLDIINTVSKCSSLSVCTAGSSSSGCNCGQGQTCCNNTCVVLQSDRNNCGACGTTCGPSTSCQSGTCR
jgi:hypothetical protein